jgi:hypothetical protein
MVAPAPSPAITPPRAETIGDISNNVAVSQPRLTRSQVADQLGVSISTVRRLEGVRLHPEIGPGNTRLFDPTEVAAVATALRRSAPPAPEPTASAISRGELAARVFERLEQRHSLSEIVVELRVAPDAVRELFHQWRVGLEQGEARRKDAVPPAAETRVVNEEELEGLLAAIPDGQLTRLSVARVAGERLINGVRVFDVVELGGLIVSGPSSRAVVVNRYGWHRFRLAASDERTHTLLWEVVTPFL